jgi:hypothetical protein
VRRLHSSDKILHRGKGLRVYRPQVFLIGKTTMPPQPSPEPLRSPTKSDPVTGHWDARSVYCHDTARAIHRLAFDPVC